MGEKWGHSDLGSFDLQIKAVEGLLRYNAILVHDFLPNWVTFFYLLST